MAKKWWETSFCFICDYWWWILLLILLLLLAGLTSSIWFPMLGGNPNNLPLLPTSTPVQTPDNWLTYADQELGYSIPYPADWEVNAPTIRQQNEYIESVILAEQAGITSQTRGLDEKARVLVLSYPKQSMELNAWIISHWNWLDGQMMDGQFLSYRSIRASTVPADSTFVNNFLWIERDQDILCFWAQTEESMPQTEQIVLKMFGGIEFIK